MYREAIRIVIRELKPIIIRQEVRTSINYALTTAEPLHPGIADLSSGLRK